MKGAVPFRIGIIAVPLTRGTHSSGVVTIVPTEIGSILFNVPFSTVETQPVLVLLI